MLKFASLFSVRETDQRQKKAYSDDTVVSSKLANYVEANGFQKYAVAVQKH